MSTLPRGTAGSTPPRDAGGSLHPHDANPRTHRRDAGGSTSPRDTGMSTLPGDAGGSTPQRDTDMSTLTGDTGESLHPHDANPTTHPRNAGGTAHPRDESIGAHPGDAKATALSAGFAEPVAGSQACFRAVLDAMARPGRIHRVGGVTPPAPIGVAAGAVLLSLVDHETPLWLDPDAVAAWDWLAFHCGAPRCEPAQAAFGLALSLPDLTAFPAGTHEMPEAAATLVVQVAALGRGRGWRLAGPGLRTPETLLVDGLPADFAMRWAANRGLFPRGVDLILCAGDQLAALPRTVTVEGV